VTTLSKLEPWSKAQIRSARKAKLAPLLIKRNLELIEQAADNFEVASFRGLIVKDCYWRWPQQGQAGNSIDFFVKVLGLSFHQAMCEIIGS